MRYDPVKDIAAKLIRSLPGARKFFFLALDFLLLRQRYVKQRILSFAPNFKQLQYYDAGAGFCQYSHFVLGRFPRAKVLASDLKIDYLSDYARYSEAAFQGRFQWAEADLQQFIPPKGYNLVTAIDILEHIEDDVSALRNMWECMDDGGILIISTPSDTDLAARFTEEHVRPGYNKAELEGKLKRCGFYILESRFSYGFWGKLAWHLLLKIPLTLFGISKLLALILPFYYLLVSLPAQLFMLLDIHTNNKAGSGIIVVARKND